MPAVQPTIAPYQPNREYRRSFLLLRWLLIILASYLTLFSTVGQSRFVGVFGFVLLFVLSNLVFTVLPSPFFGLLRVQKTFTVVDVLFVLGTMYFLRVSDNYLYFIFFLVFLLASVWRDLKVVLFSLIAVSVLYGVFSCLRFIADSPDPSHDLERFLTLSLFFIVSIFYLFLTDRLRDNARLTSMMLDEKRRAEVMSEITRSISSSLNSQEVLYLIANRLCELFAGRECSIVRVDPQTRVAQVTVNSKTPRVEDLFIDLAAYPELQQAYDSRELVFLPGVTRNNEAQSVIAVPMLVQESVLGLIYIALDRDRHELLESAEPFLKVISGTAANALRNAQLFEEMEHRARTDFLTGLPNHRFFQSSLSMELGRAQRHNHPLSLLIIDLDFLKEVNDRFGHPSGDAVIRSVAETIRTTCREFDFAARYGGEEFTVILPETPLTGAIQVADRIREHIAARSFPGIGSITASIGVSNFPVNALSKEDLIRVADQALYVAKNNGRDRVAYFNYQLITR